MVEDARLSQPGGQRVMLRHEPHVTGLFLGTDGYGDALVHWDDDVALLMPIPVSELVVLD